MRMFLTSLLVLFLPLTAFADNPESRILTGSETPIMDLPEDGEPLELEKELEVLAPYGNPYSPFSPTNFDAFVPPLVDVSMDRSRLRYLRESRSIAGGLRFRNPSDEQFGSDAFVSPLIQDTNDRSWLTYLRESRWIEGGVRFSDPSEDRFRSAYTRGVRTGGF